MDKNLILGLFALYVVAISLYGILSGSCDSSLALVRKAWGRARGLCLYFCVHVVLPLLFGIVFIGWGTVHFSAAKPGSVANGMSGAMLELDWQAIREMREAAAEELESEVSLAIPLCA